MLRRCLVALMVSASWLTWTALAAAASPGNEPPFYQKKATWQETVLASREALLRAEADDEKQEGAKKAADPVLGGFQPVHGELLGKQSPRQVHIRVAGLKFLYIGAKGPTDVFFGDARLIDRQGRAMPLMDVRSSTAGLSVRLDAGKREPVKIGKQVFESGFEIRDGEIGFQLDGKAESVELWVAPRRDAAATSYWIECRAFYKRETRSLAARETIWRLACEQFPERPSALERRVEEDCAIWKQDWKPGDVAELARRYAMACHGDFRKTAEKRIETVRTPADLKAIRDLVFLERARPRLELAQRTLEFVERSAPRPQWAAPLKSLETRLTAAEQTGGADAVQLYCEAADLRRRIIFSHPALDFDKLLIDKRSARLPEHMCDQYLGRHSQPGDGLVVLESWKERPKETVLLEGKLPAGGLIHPDLSSDGKRVLFAFADHTSTRTGVLRGYFIYELSLETGKVRQVTGTPGDPMIGQKDRQTVLIEDTNPCYLPDGGFAFVSTRSQQFGRCHGGRYVPSYTLYRAELDGSNLRPLSFNESNEWGPSVLPDGLIVYTRWDYVNRHDTIFQSLWVMRPDGTATAHYYKNNSRSPCFVGECRAIPGSHKTVATAAAHHGQTMGTIIVVDPYKGQDGGEPLTWITPELGFPEASVPQGIAISARPLPEDVPHKSEDERRSPRAATPYALSEDLFLVAYPEGREQAVYLVDTLGGRELIYADPAISCFNPIPLRPTPRPPVVPTSIAGREKESSGEFFIQDVYQCSHPIERGTIKRLRVNEIISQPTSSAPVRSWAANELVKRVLGTVPVNEDGSAAFEAPAGTLLQLQLLDENDMAVMTMRSAVYLQPGERATCVGCHEPRNNSPVAQSRLKPLHVHAIQPPAGPQYDGGLSFVRTVQPVLDRYCIGCHGLDKTEGDINLLGTMETDAPRARKAKQKNQDPRYFSVAYYDLVSRGNLVKVAPRNGETYPSRPKDYFAHAGRLAGFLLAGHPDRLGNKVVEIDRESFRRIVDWLDLNAQFYGDYSFNRIETQPPLPAGEKALREAIEKRFGPELASQPFAALVNAALPAESRILKAPLAQQAGGWGQIANGGWRDAAEPSYRELARLVAASIAPLAHHDVAGTCGHDDGCRCGVCWVRKDIAARAKAANASVAAGKSN